MLPYLLTAWVPSITLCLTFAMASRQLNQRYDDLGEDAVRSLRARRVDRIPCPKADLWIGGEDDLDFDFLTSFRHAPLIVNCKDQRVLQVDAVCSRCGYTEPILLNIGWSSGRERRFFMMLQEARNYLEQGRDVVVFCRAGVHRAALTVCCMLMMYFPMTFEDARRRLEEIRPMVDLDAIIRPNWDGKRRRYTEDHRQYIEIWQRNALTGAYALTRLAPSAPAPAPTMSLSGSASSSAYVGPPALADGSSVLPHRRTQAADVRSSQQGAVRLHARQRCTLCNERGNRLNSCWECQHLTCKTCTFWCTLCPKGRGRYQICRQCNDNGGHLQQSDKIWTCATCHAAA